MPIRTEFLVMVRSEATKSQRSQPETQPTHKEDTLKGAEPPMMLREIEQMAGVSGKEHCILMARAPQSTATKDNWSWLFSQPSPLQAIVINNLLPSYLAQPSLSQAALHPHFPTWLFIL